MTRLYVEEWSGLPTAFLATQEFTHVVSRVLRLKPGAELVLLNGRGAIGYATIASINQKSVEIQIHRVETGKLEHHAILLFAMSKGDKNEWVIQKGTELGFTGFVLFNSDHTAIKNSRVNEARMKKIEIEAMRQSGNPFLPALTFCANLEEAIAQVQQCAQKIWLDEKAEGLESEQIIQRFGSGSIAICVGPEGGWSEKERDTLHRDHWLSTRISTYVLRCETAAFSAMSIWAALKK